MDPRPSRTTRTSVTSIVGPDASTRRDEVATEEPLEIRLCAGGEKRTVAVTMRTPGSDFELATGFLFAEGILPGPGSLDRITYCTDRDVGEEQRLNIVNVFIRHSMPDLAGLQRHFYTSSACGVCGKASLESLSMRGMTPLVDPAQVDSTIVSSLPAALREAQKVFQATGGLHAAALFTTGGELVTAREDVGRHNAVDKVLGWAVQNDRVPLTGHILMVSGRSSYEIVQKALAGGIPIVCSVSAPSSLAVEVAQTFGITLVGFLRGDRFNIYTNDSRILVGTPASR